MVSPLAIALSEAPTLTGVLGLAFLLGLRHAADPDHLVAVSTLIAGTRGRGSRAAARLGAAWGAGHALTLTAFGLPIVLVQAFLPGTLQRIAEAAIGAVIVALGAQLLWRWRRGSYHVHVHRHGGLQHSHVHRHAESPAHEHAHRPVRTPLAAFFIGCVHGAGGSAALGILLVAGVPDRQTAVAALIVLAGGTAVSMAALSGAVGTLLTAGAVRRRLTAAIPGLASFSMLFGLWYALAAWDLVSYPL
jgi:ABC-type nickel/cobalt efflux system permease component RcnA